MLSPPASSRDVEGLEGLLFSVVTSLYRRIVNLSHLRLAKEQEEGWRSGRRSFRAGAESGQMGARGVAGSSFVGIAGNILLEDLVGIL